MKRRQFISRTLKAGTAAFISTRLPLPGLSQNKKLGIALVGLGRYASGQLAPALLETNLCYLAGIVTGTPEKEILWAQKYNIPAKNIYNYKNFDNIADNPDIDIVYVVLPNNMHAEYTIRAAEAGKHVICEKPMAITVDECQKMIDTCSKAGKKLSIGYRLHFELHHQRIMELGQQAVYGSIRQLSSGFSFVLSDHNAWRLNKQMAGGGPLVDLGIYCIQGSIYTSGELPESVTAKNITIDKEFFTGVEGTIEWTLKFPSGYTSSCISSYENVHNYLKAKVDKGIIELRPAFSYSGINGITPDGPMNLPAINQQARQMDAFTQCVMQDTGCIVPGEMGMRDVFIIRKIYEAAASGKEVSLKGIPEVLQKV